MRADRHPPAFRLRSALRRWRRELARSGSTDERVHEARVVLKEARAVLRLFRASMAGAEAEAWDQRLRLAMKALAPARDGVVVRAVLEDSMRRLPEAEDQAVVRRALPPVEKAKPGALRRIGPLLDALERDWVPVARAVRWEPVDQAFARALRRVRRLQSKAGRDDAPALWHRWRRRVKELAYQADFVRPPDHPPWKPLRRNAWRLQSALGVVQDLNVTRDYLPTLGLPASPAKHLQRHLRRAAEKARRRAWRERLGRTDLRG